MKRTVAIALVALALVGCTHSTANFHATIEPNHGRVPYEATITASDIGRSYTFHLPGETITQDSPSLEVTVDSLNWRATVETMCGGRPYSDDVRATGNNAPPTAYAVIINGDRGLWEMCPLERTLLEFDLSPGATVIRVDVWGDAFSQHYSIFCPPYDGTYHALWRGYMLENACIVYPVYCSVPGEALPYSPTNLDEGYPYREWRGTNAIDWGSGTGSAIEIPEQQAYIRVTVRDSLGQGGFALFTPRIRAVNFR